MSMPSYPVLCYHENCKREAIYKVASRWSDGVTGELKTYYLACADCVGELYLKAREKRDLCQLAVGESLDPPSVFLMKRGSRDQQLIRCEDFERKWAT